MTLLQISSPILLFYISLPTLSFCNLMCHEILTRSGSNVLHLAPD